MRLAPDPDPFILLGSVEPCVGSDTRVAVDSAALKGAPATTLKLTGQPPRIDFFYHPLYRVEPMQSRSNSFNLGAAVMLHINDACLGRLLEKPT